MFWLLDSTDATRSLSNRAEMLEVCAILVQRHVKSHGAQEPFATACVHFAPAALILQQP